MSNYDNYQNFLGKLFTGSSLERINSLPEESIREVADFIEFLEAKRKRLVKGEGEKEDPLSNVIGICEGPSDLVFGEATTTVVTLKNIWDGE